MYMYAFWEHCSEKGANSRSVIKYSGSVPYTAILTHWESDYLSCCCKALKFHLAIFFQSLYCWYVLENHFNICALSWDTTPMKDVVVWWNHFDFTQMTRLPRQKTANPSECTSVCVCVCVFVCVWAGMCRVYVLYMRVHICECVYDASMCVILKGLDLVNRF